MYYILALMDENVFDFPRKTVSFFSGIHKLLTAPWSKFSIKPIVGKDHSSLHSNSQFKASCAFQILSSRSVQKEVKSLFPTFASSCRRKSWM